MIEPTPTNQPNFQVQKVPVYGNLILAPMDGFSDLPFRSLCRAMGSAMSYTGFINALDVLHGHPTLNNKLTYLEHERPVVYQLFDSDMHRLLNAAQKLVPWTPDIIDINMGCSVRRVSGRGAGAGLLQEPGKVGDMVSLLSHTLDLPVTAKIRLGWDEKSRTYIDIAHAIEDNGGALIAVHGRTRSQGYSGNADWDAIAEIKQTVSIPVIANGDVQTVIDIQRIVKHTGCDGVMIGRGAIGNPWIFSCRDRSEITSDQVLETMRSHLDQMLLFYGEPRGLVLFRKHASQYLRPLALPSEKRALLLTLEESAEFLKSLEQIIV